MKGILTLCGPTKFYETFDRVMLELTLAGWGVFTLGSHRGADTNLDPKVDAHQTQLDALHKDKIEVSQAVVVINVGGYIGDHTKGEVAHARGLGKEVYWYDLKAAMHRLVEKPPSAPIKPEPWDWDGGDKPWTSLIPEEQRAALEQPA